MGNLEPARASGLDQTAAEGGAAEEHATCTRPDTRRRGRYKVRQVTDYQASWVEKERGEEGQFTIQLILDNGVEEYVLDVDSDDMEPLLTLLARSGHTTFDLERRVLMFANMSAG